jgi:hypothetical protein
MMGGAHSWLNGGPARADGFPRLCKRPDKMNLLSCFKLAASATLCALVIGCASVDTAPATVVRTAPPKNYEKTITDYLAFKIRGPQKNAEISVGAPEPGACALDAYTTSSRGWVVPVAYATRTGEATGKDTIRINSKQYYFWFLGNTIAGITPRVELCPGVGSGFESPTPEPAAGGPVTTALPVSTNADAKRPEEADAKASTGQKSKTSSSSKKTSSGKARPPAKKKTGDAPATTKPN